MGEYADDRFRDEIKNEYGFDPGSMYEGHALKKLQKVQCKICNKRVKACGLKDHMRDAHKERRD